MDGPVHRFGVDGVSALGPEFGCGIPLHLKEDRHGKRNREVAPGLRARKNEP